MWYADQIFWLVIPATVVASVSWTVTQEEIFREPREWAKAKSESASAFIVRKFFYVWTCEYCFSHWVTLSVLILTGFRLLLPDWRGFIIAFFAVPWLANQFMSLYRRLRIDIKREGLKAEVIKHEKIEKEKAAAE